MKNTYLLLLLIVSIQSSLLSNPHDINITDVGINSPVCKNCHISSKSTISEYTDSDSNFLPDDIVTAGTDEEVYSDITQISSSTLCLGCHDGVYAKIMTYKTIFSINTQSSHPVSIEYIEGKAGLRQKNTLIDNWDNASLIDDILADGKVECISCHNPHNKTNDSHLRHNNSRSSLCYTCHDK